MSEGRKYHEEIVAVYGDKLRNCPSADYLDAVQYGQSLLCLGRLAEALEAFELADRLARAKLKGTSGYLSDIGTTQWLLGNRGEAMSNWRRLCEGILDRTITYADLAGGVSQGLLLWYGAITEGHGENLAFSQKYLRRRTRREDCKTFWPGPLACFALGEWSSEQVLMAAEFETPDLDKAIRRSRKDVLARRHLIQALFYFGVQYRRLGDEEKCKEMMQTCASLEDPLVELEWYLARHELGLPMLDDC